ncbi:MAG: phosphatidate cytidylyltransferase [Chitinophagaceae bacterium]
MAFNWQTFRTRTLSSIIFVGLMLAGLLWNQWSFLVLFSLIHFGCWWEYLKLTEKIHQTSFHAYTKLGLMVMGYGLLLWFCGPAYQVNGYGLKENLSLPVSAAGFALLLLGIFQRKPVKLKAFGMAALGLLYISLSWGLMMDLAGFTTSLIYKNGMPINPKPFDYLHILIPLVVIISIWVNDTMAYLVGSMIGRTPLSKISPKKTWEGTLGGIILCIIGIGYWFSGMTFNGQIWFIIAAITAIAGVSGDLFESKLKRMANVKDSGAIMPGHGGFLDRFDSLLFATPFVWLYIQLFIK